jgi:predicted Zn-dependent peptidase
VAQVREADLQECKKLITSDAAKFFVTFASEMDYHLFTLSNGLRVVFKPEALPIAHACIVINAGTRDESPEQFGIAHFTEHLIFKKTAKRSTNQILNRLELVGADLNAYTTKEYTCIHASFLNEHLNRTLDLFEDIIFHSTFPENEIEKEKGIILDEIASYQDSPEDAIADDFEDLIYVDHELGHNILGDEKSLVGLSKKDFEKFAKDYYQPENMVIGITGNYSYNKIKKIVERYYGDLPNHSHNQKRTTPRAGTPRKLILDRPINQVHYMLGSKGYSMHDPKKTGLMVLNNMLGGIGMSSRLNLEIREKHGIAYTIESNYTTYSDTGIFSVYFGTETDKMQQAYKLVLKEFKKLRDKKLSANQLKQSKNKFIGQIALGEENRIALIIAMAKNIIDYGDVETLPKIYERINNVTADDIWNISNEILDPNNLNSLIFQPDLNENL